MKNQMMTDTEFAKKVSEICTKFKGIESAKYAIDEGKCFIVPTKHGPAHVSIHLPGNYKAQKNGYIESIYIKFPEFSTGKIYDTLYGWNFNGYSGKWNITSYSATKNQKLVRESLLFDLEIRLEKATTL